MCRKLIFLISFVLVLGLVGSAGATVTLVGADVTTNGAWRTAAALETDNEYGTDGYLFPRGGENSLVNGGSSIDPLLTVAGGSFITNLDPSAIPCYVTPSYITDWVCGAGLNPRWCGYSGWGNIDLAPSLAEHYDDGDPLKPMGYHSMGKMEGGPWGSAINSTLTRTSGSSFRLIVILGEGYSGPRTQVVTVTDADNSAQVTVTSTAAYMPPWAVFDISAGDSPVEVDVDVPGGQPMMVGLAFDPVPAAAYYQATGPDPANNELSAPIGPISWAPGAGADKHDVYFGDEEAAVTDANASDLTGIYRGRQDTNSYDVSGELVYSDTYYWRIDEVYETPEPNVIVEGLVWQFTVEINLAMASNPRPADSAIDVNANTQLKWDSGVGANKHDVYLDINKTAVTDANTSDTTGVYRGRRDVNDYDPGGGLMGGYYYFWRVDEVNEVPEPDVITKGVVWKFKVEGAFGGGVYAAGGDTATLGLWRTGALLETDNEYGTDGYFFARGGVGDPGGWIENLVTTNGGSFRTQLDPTVISCDQLPAYIYDFKMTAGAGEGHSYYNATHTGGYGLLELAPGLADTSSPSGWYDSGAEIISEGYNDEVEVTLVRESGSSFRLTIIIGEMYLAPLTRVVRVSDGDNSAEVILTTLAGGKPVYCVFDIAAGSSDIDIYMNQIPPQPVQSNSITAIAFDAYDPTTALKASNPNPKNVEQDVQLGSQLSWTPGTGADKHQVYLDTDETAVTDADTSDTTGVYRGQQDTNSYDLAGKVLINTTYFWRIDEVNEVAGPNVITTGDVWNFTMTEHPIVDNFNNYPTSIDLRSAWVEVDPTTGNPVAWEGVELEKTIAHDVNAMKYGYQNQYSPHCTEAVKTYGASDPDRNWDRAGIRALAVWFRGTADNVSEQMYVKLVDNDTPSHSGKLTHPDVDAVQTLTWTRWDIDLGDVAFASVNTANLKSVAIGFGDGSDSGQPGADYDYVYIDDVMLYSSRCVGLPGYRMLGDIAGGGAYNVGDCVVDYQDIDVLTAEWLSTDFGVTAVQPDDSNMLVHWKFDEAGGATTADASGNNNDGTLLGNPQFVIGGVTGNCLLFDGTGDIVECLTPNNFASILDVDNPFSANVWLYMDTPPQSGGLYVHENTIMWIIGTGQRGCTQNRGLVNYNTINCFVGTGTGWPGLVPASEPFDVGNWHMVTVTWDKPNLRIYKDVKLILDTTLPGLDDLSNYDIRLGHLNGSCWGADYDGKMDEFSVWKHCLTQGEVAYMRYGAGDIYSPLTAASNIVPKSPPGPPYNPANPDVVNFKDYSSMANDWLKEELWPAD